MFKVLRLRLANARNEGHMCSNGGAAISHRTGGKMSRKNMNIDVPISDDRRIEIVANGSQKAVHATIVTRTGEPQPGADVHPGRTACSAVGLGRQVVGSAGGR